jgi:hypothetical protein
MVVSMRPVPVVLDIDRISTNKVVFQQLTAEGAENRIFSIIRGSSKAEGNWGGQR